MTAKKVFERIYKTFIMVFNTLYGLLMTILCVAALFQSDYAIRDMVPAVLMSASLFALVNGINVIIRKYIENY